MNPRPAMKVLILGATGMVGQGVLRECLAATDVTQVATLGRRPVGRTHPKLADHVTPTLDDPPDTLLAQFSGFDACFFCLGVSSSGMDETTYAKMTRDLALGFAGPLAARNPGMTFVYVSGAGTDPDSRTMWARVKGETEAALIALPFRAAYCLRPGVILPANGERSGVTSYRLVYRFAGPVLRLARRFAPRHLLTTETIGRAMLSLARSGWPRPILEAPDIHDASKKETP
jgi:uncharacterized protein YbjT (DUF2867 family)